MGGTKEEVYIESKGMSLEDSYYIKGIAVLMLLYLHLFWSSSRWQFYYSLIKIKGWPLAALSTLPSQPVISIFLYITGYGLFKKYEKLQGIKEFACDVKQRIIRVYKIYWFIFGLGTLVVFLFHGKILGGGIYDTPLELLIDLLGISYLFDTNTLNSSWWYMAPLVLSYMIAPLVYRVVKGNSKSVFIISNLVIIIFFVFFRTGKSAGGVMDLAIRIVPLFAGMIVAKENIDSKMVEKLKGNKAIQFLLIVILGLLFICKFFESTYVLDTYIATIEVLFILLFLRNTDKNIDKDITWISDLLKYLGRNSLIIWLTHSFFILYFPQIVYFLRVPILIYPWFLIICLITEKIVSYLCLRKRI